MKNILKILIIIIVVIIILVVSSLVILNKKDDNGYVIVEKEYDPITPQKYTSNIVSVLDARNEFYIVKDCINKYFSYRLKSNEENLFGEDLGEDISNKVVYSMLDEEYIKYKQIKEENIFDKIPKVEKLVKVEINKVLVVRYSENENLYIAYGNLINKLTEDKNEYSIGLRINMLDHTFKIMEEEYIKEKYGKIIINEEIDIDFKEDIQNNEYNIFEYNYISDEEYVEDLFNKLKEDIVYNKELVYQELNKEYSQKRFGNYKEFEKYISNNFSKIITSKMVSYEKKIYTDYIQYTCLDSKGHFWIFKEVSAMNYEILLDTYTIDIPQFIEKYNSSKDQIKIGMNIEKLLTAINEKDYRYVYNKLDDTFKQNNFDTFDKFVDYMRENTYDNNTIEYGEYEDKGSVFVYKSELINSNNESEKREWSFIMKLQEETDFSFSFNVH